MKRSDYLSRCKLRWTMETTLQHESIIKKIRDSKVTYLRYKQRIG